MRILLPFTLALSACDYSKPGEMPAWLVYLLTHWPLELALAIVFLVVIFRLPADAWLALFGDRKPKKEGS